MRQRVGLVLRIGGENPGSRVLVGRLGTCGAPGPFVLHWSVPWGACGGQVRWAGGGVIVSGLAELTWL
eukprot:4802156-Alexandrium_andersonii.AAC.1